MANASLIFAASEFLIGIVTVKAIDSATQNEKTMVLSGSLSEEEMTKMLRDADENKASDEMFRQLSDLREWLTTLKIQLLELIDTNSLNAEDIAELKDLKESIEADYMSENFELLSGLVQSGKELIKELSEKVYAEAKKVMQ